MITNEKEAAKSIFIDFTALFYVLKMVGSRCFDEEASCFLPSLIPMSFISYEIDDFL